MQTQRQVTVDDAADSRFEEQVRAFADAHCPRESRAKVAGNVKVGRADMLQWQRILHGRGWGAPGWPRKFGGTGWSVKTRLLFERAVAACDCPPQPLQGLRHIGPVLIRFGNTEQQDRYLPNIVSGTHLWCQGFSEPGAGSDLAALSTRAEPCTAGYRVNGQKLWTSHAHEADMMFALVRTSREARKQDGISMLLVPMDSPGLTVRPIPTIDGWHHVNEVFLDDVEVTRENLVGEQGDGWRIAKYLLDRERLGPVELLPAAIRFLERVRALVELTAFESSADGHAVEDDLVRIEAQLIALSEIGEQAVDAMMEGRPLTVEPSTLKLGWSHAVQDISELALEQVARHQALRFVALESEPTTIEEQRGAIWQNFLYLRAFTIFGGSTEIQKNIVAKHLFQRA